MLNAITVSRSGPWRLVGAGLCVEGESARCFAELRDASERSRFVALPALLANACHVVGLDRLKGAIADGRLRLCHEDRAMWDAFRGGQQ